MCSPDQSNMPVRIQDFARSRARAHPALAYAAAAADAIDEHVAAADFAAGRAVRARHDYFQTHGMVQLRAEPHANSAWVTSSTGVIRIWAIDTAFVCTGRRSEAWVEVRAPGGHSRGWIRSRALR